MKNISYKHIWILIELAIPIIIGQIGHTITNMTDTAVVGMLGVTEQAAVSQSTNIFILLLVFGIGISTSLTPLTADANAKKDHKTCASIFRNGLIMNFLIGVVLFLVLFFAAPLFHLLQQPKDVTLLAIPFIRVLVFSMIPLSIFFACKQFVEGLAITKPGMYISIAGNILNIVLNIGMVFGKWGMPEMGYMGSCWATFIARTFMALAYIGYILYDKELAFIRHYFPETKIERSIFWKLFSMGFGTAMQYTFEVSAFSIAGIFVGWVGKASIAAHGIALQLASATYMIASGISNAATIKIADAKGLKQYNDIKLYVKGAYIVALLVMLVTGILFLVFNTYLPMLFSADKEVISIASSLLILAAGFQLFDGAQVVGASCLRGLSDVTWPTLYSLTAWWGIGLPMSYVFGIYLHYEAMGVWFGLTLGLAFVSFAMGYRLRRFLKQLSVD
jgi:multidrug resistance protein, MATE family